MVDQYLFANNATSRLRIDTPAGSGTITVVTGDGAKFPSPSDPQFFTLTIEDRRTGQIEICKCTARSGDILTVLRAQEGTSAQDFLAGAVAANRVTAATLAYFQALAVSSGGYTQIEADDRFVHKTGDTLSGPLLGVTPTLATHLTRKDYVDTGLATKSNTGHTHPQSDVSNLMIDLAARPTDAPNNSNHYIRSAGGWLPITWSALQGKPSVFAPDVHSHAQSDITGLVSDQAAQTTAINLRLQDAAGSIAADNAYYARRNNSWVSFTIGLTDAPSDGTVYTRKDGVWFGIATVLSNYLPLAGGTMSGSVILNHPAQLILSNAGTTYGYFTLNAGIYCNPALYSGSSHGGVFYSYGTGGGIIAYHPGATVYGALGYSGWGLYTNGKAYVASQLEVNGLAFFPANAGSTTGNTANVWINSSAGNLARSTSSVAYKTDIEPLWDQVGDKILELKPIYYRSNKLTIDDPNLSWYSLTAEDAAAVDPRFALWDQEFKRDEKGEMIPVYVEAEVSDPEDPSKIVIEKQHRGFEVQEAKTPMGLNGQGIQSALINLVQRMHATILQQDLRIKAFEEWSKQIEEWRKV